MGKTLLAIDVGGSTSRAYVVDLAGNCLGRGRTGGGNPASTNPDQAAEAIISSVEAAVAEAGGDARMEIVLAQIALAGPRAHVAVAKLETAFRALGLTGPLVFAGDLLAMFASVTPEPDGYCIVSGTGAGAVRIRDRQIERAVDAVGWLLGDTGSGYWLGHHGARAVVDELDGRGEPTALTPVYLGMLNIAWPDARQDLGRALPLRHFIDAIYAMRPIELARFAPLVLANRGDPVASRLIASAENRLADDFAHAFDRDMPGPVALGGGVIAHLTGLRPAIADVIRAAGHEPDIRLVTDGSVGAIVLAMLSAGLSVGPAEFETISRSLAVPRAK